MSSKEKYFNWSRASLIAECLDADEIIGARDATIDRQAQELDAQKHDIKLHEYNCALYQARDKVQLQEIERANKRIKALEGAVVAHEKGMENSCSDDEVDYCHDVLWSMLSEADLLARRQVK